MTPATIVVCCSFVYFESPHRRCQQRSSVYVGCLSEGKSGAQTDPLMLFRFPLHSTGTAGDHEITPPGIEKK